MRRAPSGYPRARGGGGVGFLSEPSLTDDEHDS
jgi:hypothetical protein